MFNKTNIAENLYEFYRTLGAVQKKERSFAFGAEYVDCEPYNWPRTFFNIADEEQLPALAQSIKKGELPAHWILLRPENYQTLYAKMEAVSFRKMMTWPGMGLALASHDFSQHTNDDKIELIKNEEDLKQWVQVVNEVLFVRSPLDYVFFEDCWRSGLFNFYAARVEGEISATAMTYQHGDDLGIYMVATSSKQRRKGLARAITVQILKDAQAADLQHAYLQASKMGAHVYHNLGFQSFCTFDIYWLLGV